MCIELVNKNLSGVDDRVEYTGFLATLVERGVLDQTGADRARAASDRTGTPIERTLLEFGLAEEDGVFRVLAELAGLPYLDADDLDPTLPGELSLPEAFLDRSEVIPAQRSEGQVMLACADPRAQEVVQTVAFHLGQPVRLALAAPGTIRAALAGLKRVDDAAQADVAEADIDRLNALAHDGPVIKLVADLIAQAVDQGASDIHIEADEVGARVRFRTDGALAVIRRIGADQSVAVASRLKVMAGLNISEKRLPQDGRLQVPVRGRRVDIRLSTLPTQFGESIVMRLLDRARLSLSWDALGFAPARSVAIETLVSAPNGIFLVAGPTGSGKTTTLYTALAGLNAEDRKIVSVEDPIEFSLPGINQVQVDPQIDMSFARALRAILRQDPDVVMVGEIRDQETAEIAVRAALMGRMVLSTIHTNDSLSAVTRLLDLGVPGFLLAATLRGVLSQRLVRRLCAECGGAGCASCRDTGRAGRGVVSELLTVSGALAQGISDAVPLADLTRIAQDAGFSGMAKDGRALVAQGIVDRLDVARALGS